MRILYIVNDLGDADLTRRQLNKTATRFRLEEAATIGDALARLERPGAEPLDLLLTDARLPDGDGLSLLANVRDRALPLAVVVITDPGDEETAAAALKAGADDCVVKRPDYLDRLPLTLESALAHSRAGAARRHSGSLVQAIGGIVWELDVPTWRLTFVSQQAERSLGYPVQQWLDETDFWAEHLHPDDHSFAVNFCREAAARGENYQFEYRMIAADGRVVWLRDIVAVEVESGRPLRLRGLSVEITERKREEAFRAGQSRVLEMIATGAPLAEVLASLVLLIESQSEGMLCSVLLLAEDGAHIRHGAAPSLPVAYVQAIDGAPIGPRAGSCGTAMYSERPVVVTDILEDPLWEDYRELAAPFGLRACWSTPVLSRQRRVLGSFAMYYREPRSPSAEEARLTHIAVRLAGIAIERQQADQALRGNQERAAGA